MTRPTGNRPGRGPRRAVVLFALVLGVVTAGLVLRGFRPQAVGATPLDEGAFAPGACLAYAPTAGDNHKTVFLDGGHGGIDPGAVGTTASGQQVGESTVNLAIELDTLALLRAHGFRVVVSRTEQTTVARLVPADTSGGVLSLQGAHDDVVARDRCANLAQADALVGIYMDASATSQNAGSVTVYDAARPFAQSNARLARLLQSSVLTAMNAEGWQIPDDGAVPDNGFGSSVGDASDGGLAAEAAAYDHLLLIGPAAAGFFSSPSAMPGAVIEPLYLSDPFEASIAANSGDQSVVAAGIASAVRQFLVPTSAS